MVCTKHLSCILTVEAYSIHTGQLPITVNTQVFAAGAHTVAIMATDTAGFTAEATVNYSLSDRQSDREHKFT